MEDVIPKDEKIIPDKIGVKRRYEQPAIESEEIFETSALACGKTSPTQSPCQAVPKSS
jgi:hypothetical protein